MLDSFSERRVWSISDLTLYIKERLETDPVLREVWVRGEISNFKHHSRGHMYFTLKDEKSRIMAVMFQGYNRFLRFIPKDGLKVIVRGEISIYERDGQYQLYVKEMQPDGIGNLYLAYEQLKSRLQSEGLFDFAHKRKLPRYPKRIALITSPTGAAIRDMITTLKRRYPYVHLLIFPVLVQGEAAPSSIIKGLKLANEYEGIDLIILGRGGGSIEELWAFNDENVARSIYHSMVPIISAVGHETDYTIADFVADLRAATPTAAAEMAVPHIREIKDMLVNIKHRLNQAIQQILQSKQNQLHMLKRSSALRNPENRLKQYEQQLDYLTDSLKRFVKQYPEKRKTELQYLKRRLNQTGILVRVSREREQSRQLLKELEQSMRKVLELKRLKFSYLIQQLDALSPLSILKRGYTLSYDKQKRLVGSVSQISPGDLLYVQFKDGVVEATIWGIKEEDTLWDKKKQS